MKLSEIYQEGLSSLERVLVKVETKISPYFKGINEVINTDSNYKPDKVEPQTLEDYSNRELIVAYTTADTQDKKDTIGAILDNRSMWKS